MRIIDLAEARIVSLHSSPNLLEEFADVLSREKHRRQVAEVGGGVAALIADYRTMCEIVEPAALTQPVAPDPDDDWVIATTLAAQADLIVTGDKPFLGVGSVGTIRIVTVAMALELLGER